MATRTITIKNEFLPELKEIFGEGYSDTLPDGLGGTIPNPQTKTQFADERFMFEIREYIRERVKGYRKDQVNLSIDVTDITDDTV